jgi:hypothetical protein
LLGCRVGVHRSVNTLWSRRVVSARELAEAFTLEEVGWARSRTRSDGHCLALVVGLKSYQRLG